MPVQRRLEHRAIPRCGSRSLDTSTSRLGRLGVQPTLDISLAVKHASTHPDGARTPVLVPPPPQRGSGLVLKYLRNLWLREKDCLFSSRGFHGSPYPNTKKRPAGCGPLALRLKTSPKRCLEPLRVCAVLSLNLSICGRAVTLPRL